MDAERWRRVRAIFEETAALPLAERGERLDAACAGDATLRAEVARLLDADARSGDFLEPAQASQVSQPDQPDPPADTLQEPLPERIGRFTIVARLGRGGFGDVWLGFDPVLRREVAIKTCLWPDEGARQRFDREAALAARLVHPNVVTVHDFGRQGGMPYLVQERLGGRDLEDIVRERVPLPLARRLEILAHVARGLAFAHRQGVVHRDVKPSNIRVLDDGQVKILDFGIARSLESSRRLTQSGSAVGSLATMAPEIVRGETGDERSDIYSFGVVAYELLAYRKPLTGESPAAILYGTVHEEPTPLREAWPECPADVARWVHRCLAKKADHRYAGFGEVLADLEAIRQGDRSSSPRRRRPATIAALLTVLVGSLLAGLLLWQPWQLWRPWRRGANPPVAAAVAPTGFVTVDAWPWARVLEVRGADGTSRLAAATAEGQTPLRFALPPGRYEIVLAHPGFPGQRTCTVEVRGGQTERCRAAFASTDAQHLLERLRG
jgi:hypothetical protein